MVSLILQHWFGHESIFVTLRELHVRAVNFMNYMASYEKFVNVFQNCNY